MGSRRVRVRSAVAFALVSAVVVPAGTAQVSAAAVTCQDVMFIGARGSGQPERFGPEVEGVRADFERRVAGVYGQGFADKYVDVAYPAESTGLLKPSKELAKRLASDNATIAYAAWVDYKQNYVKRWFDGLNLGVDFVDGLLARRAARCPNEKYVLAGYSQGAMVMHRALLRLERQDRRAELSRIVGIALIADGDRVPNTATRLLGSAPDSGEGIADFRQSGNDIPAQVAERTINLCDNNDIVCDFSIWDWRSLFQRGVDIHEAYDGRPELSVLGRFLTSRLRDAIPPPPPPPAGQLSLISVDRNGGPGDEASYESSVSGDGRYVAFASDSDDLVVGDTASDWDVFVRDVQYGTTTQVSVDRNGDPANASSDQPSISANGRYVAFSSAASDLVAGATNGDYNIFLRDIQAGTTTLVSVSREGGGGNGWSSSPSVSADGRYVAFESYADDLVPGDTNFDYDVFVRDLEAGTTILVSKDRNGGPANDDSYDPAISADGHHVAFTSGATDLMPERLSDNTENVFLRDINSGSTSLISINRAGSASGWSSDASVSGDGRYVAFTSFADNLVRGHSSESWDVYMRDVQAGTTALVSVDKSGGSADGRSGAASVSADGRYVAFDSVADDVVPGDKNGYRDVFLRDVQAGTTRLLSFSTSGGSANSSSYAPSVSADGRHISFESYARDLVLGDAPGYLDVFLWRY